MFSIIFAVFSAILTLRKLFLTDGLGYKGTHRHRGCGTIRTTREGWCNIFSVFSTPRY